MTIQIVDQDLVRQIEQIAATEQRTPEQIVADALRLYTTQTLRDLTNILPGHASKAEYQRYLEQKYDLHD